MPHLQRDRGWRRRRRCVSLACGWLVCSAHWRRCELPATRQVLEWRSIPPPAPWARPPRRPPPRPGQAPTGSPSTHPLDPPTHSAHLGDEPHLGGHKRVLVVQLYGHVEDAALKGRVARACGRARGAAAGGGRAAGERAAAGAAQAAAAAASTQLPSADSSPAAALPRRQCRAPLRQPMSFCSESPCTSIVTPLARSRSMSRISFCTHQAAAAAFAAERWPARQHMGLRGAPAPQRRPAGHRRRVSRGGGVRRPAAAAAEGGGRLPASPGWPIGASHRPWR